MEKNEGTNLHLNHKKPMLETGSLHSSDIIRFDPILGRSHGFKTRLTG